MATRATSVIGWRTVVSGGQAKRELEVSSKPATERSRGISSRSSWAAVSAASASLATGFVLGAARLGLELGKGSTSGFLYWYADVNFLHFAIFLFAVCTGVLVAVSLVTPAQSDEKLAGLSFATAAGGRGAAADRLESDPRWRRRDVILSIVLVAAVALVWLASRG